LVFTGGKKRGKTEKEEGETYVRGGKRSPRGPLSLTKQFRIVKQGQKFVETISSKTLGERGRRRNAESEISFIPRRSANVGEVRGTRQFEEEAVKGGLPPSAQGNRKHVAMKP